MTHTTKHNPSRPDTLAEKPMRRLIPALLLLPLFGCKCDVRLEVEKRTVRNQAPYPRVVVPNRPGWCACPDCGGTGKGGDHWSRWPQDPNKDCDYCHGTGIWKLCPPPEK